MSARPMAKTYADGLNEGRIRTLETVTAGHKERLDNHALRLRIVEKIVYAVLGIVAFIQVLPVLRTAFAG